MNYIRKIILLNLLVLNEILVCPQSGLIPGEPKIAYWKSGKSCTTILIVNGGPGLDHTYLQPEWNELSNNFQIIFYDQRGCGKSDHSTSYTWCDHLCDLKRLKDYISPDERVIIAGSSWGSNLALLYAIYFPHDIKGLIITGFTDWKGVNEMKADLVKSLKSDLMNFKRPVIPNNEFDSIISSRKISSAQFFDNLKYNEMTNMEIEKRFLDHNDEVTSLTLKSLASMPELKFLHEIEIPTLIIRGDLNCGFPDWSDIIAEIIHKSKLVTIHNSCHDPWYSNSAIFFEKCIAFINDVGKL